jgi:hypothetical protein
MLSPLHQVSRLLGELQLLSGIGAQVWVLGLDVPVAQTDHDFVIWEMVEG